MSVWFDGDPLDETSGYVREDPDQLGYFMGARPVFEEHDVWVEECPDCEGRGMWLDGRRLLHLCATCDAEGVLPHACED